VNKNDITNFMSSKVSTVAIVDDDEVFQMLIKRILEKKIGADSILQFPNGSDALSYFMNNTNNIRVLPLVIFLDINMPGMDGWQFLKELIKLQFSPSYKPSVFMISGADTFDFEELRAYPIVKRYLVKPIAASDVINIIESELSDNGGNME